MKIAAAAVTAVAALSATGTAYAQSFSQSTSGASSSGTWVFNRYDRGVLNAQLNDTSADSHSVYLLAHADGYADNRWNLTAGSGSSMGINYTLTWNDAVQYTYIKTCRNVQAAPDNCSSQWKSAINPYHT